MRKIPFLLLILCILSTQVFGSIVHHDEYQTQGDMHNLMHEIGQPHSHDHEDESEFTLSYSKEAIEHISQDIACCISALTEITPLVTLEIKPTGAISSFSPNWSPPFLKHNTPPPKA